MTITKEKLEKMYNTYSNKDVCIKLGVSEPTLIGMIERAGIQKKGKGKREKIRVI
ncbi:MAG: hypothetical protein GY777_26870 [Candidatus Brocadiaceae bacterium]|nr:hypothetical protein [Candidatus Brocadiaceae bacterium]